MRFISRRINLKGELFSSTFTYGLTSLVKLGSSLVLTRILNPEAYGVLAILVSILFMVELMSDIGVSGLVIRHERGGEKKFVHSVWTMHLIRGCINFCVLYALAPFIARLYESPVLEDALRTFSFWFLIQGLQSLSFTLAQRDQKSRISNYADFATSLVMTLVVIGLASVLKSFYAFVYGMLLQRMLMTIASHFYYREIGVGIAFDRGALSEQFKFARFVLPSSLLTIAASQYDKVVLLKLFDLSLLGIYGIAGNMIGPVGGLVTKNSRVVLYARCAQYFRDDRTTAAFRFYRENTRLLAVGTLLPAAVAGFSQLIVALLYDVRYVSAGYMLTALGLSAMVGSFQQASENLLIASGRTHVGLVGNVLGLVVIVPATLLGYKLFGFYGFLWFGPVASLVVLSYFFWEQRKQGLLDIRAELVRFGWALAMFAVCLLASRLILHFIPDEWLHLKFIRNQ